MIYAIIFLVIFVYYIKDIVTNEIIITKSKFITTLIPVSSALEASTCLKEVREKYIDATHNCYAYLIGDNLEIQKCSDDGEPQKTAGSPMLEALKKSNVTNIMAVVTRYFGGTLLGASGLIRAYSTSVFEALNKTTLYIKELFLETQISLSYKEYNNLTKLNYIFIIDTLFQSDILVKIRILKEDKTRLLADLYNILKDDIKIDFVEVEGLKKRG